MYFKIDKWPHNNKLFKIHFHDKMEASHLQIADINCGIGDKSNHSGIFDGKLSHAQKIKCFRVLKKGRNFFFSQI